MKTSAENKDGTRQQKTVFAAKDVARQISKNTPKKASVHVLNGSRRIFIREFYPAWKTDTMFAEMKLKSVVDFVVRPNSLLKLAKLIEVPGVVIKD